MEVVSPPQLYMLMRKQKDTHIKNSNAQTHLKK